MHYQSLTLMIVLLAGACASPPHLGEAPPADPVPVDLAAADQRRLQLSSLVLTSDANDVDAQVRAAAAAELLSLYAPQARELLIKALGSDRPEVQKATLEAIRDAPSIDLSFRDVLVETLPQSTDQLQPLIIELVARYGQHDANIMEQITSIALDDDRAASERIAAIHSLGSFHHAPARAAGKLMQVLGQNHGSDSPIELAATRQLASLTGLPKQDNAQYWLTWWRENRDRPSERWLQDTVDALTKQATVQTQQLTEARAEQQRMSERVLTTYRDFWPFLSIEQQQEQLLPLLHDELPAIRLFGLNRLAVQLRDGHANPQGEAAGLTLLEDPDPIIRRAAASLLPEFGPDEVATAVAAQFTVETDAAVLATLLPRIASSRPDLLSPQKLTALLGQDAVRPAAMHAVQTVLSDPARRTAEFIDALRPAVRAAYGQSPDPEGAIALGLVGDENDLVVLAQKLDEDDATWRAAAAQALFMRGMHEPLKQRATDPAVYPFVLSAADAIEGLPGLREIAGLNPPEEFKPRWTKSLLESAAQIDPADAVQADEILATLPDISAAQRAAALQRAFGSDQLDGQAKVDLATRLGPLVLQTGDPRAVVTMIDQIPEGRRTPELGALRFTAAIRGRLFDEAAETQNDLPAWIEAFEEMKATQPEAADLVRTEIVKRFQDDLDESALERLGLAADPMMGDAAEPEQQE
ncbi:MAG: hypothetical protein GY894_01070 [Planctomycetes bacterium]|nr:hypothetical protein [Planctomycetota bacterium]MCP4837940.1 hypothetical protein [Planctomycetota bacterium]